MKAFSQEELISQGHIKVNKLFDLIKKDSHNFEAADAEQTIFSEILKLGLLSMQYYFSCKGSGDLGETVKTEDGNIYKKEKKLFSKSYFSVFGKLQVLRAGYVSSDGLRIIPLDKICNLPVRSYSYLLQKWVDIFGLGKSFKEAETTFLELLGIKISQSRIEIITRESNSDYDNYYRDKKLPDPKSEGEIHVTEFDGKGVPMIKSEAAKIESRPGRGEKRQKKKEALVGVSFTIDRKKRTAEEVAKNLVYPENSIKKDKSVNKIRAQNIRRMASIERTKKEVMNNIVDDAKDRFIDKSDLLVVVMDGALGLWKQIGKCLKGNPFVGILDIIHVIEYLWRVANALLGEKNPDRKKWVYDHLLSILEGNIGRVIGGLKQIRTKRKLKGKKLKEVNKVITYFENHRHWMHYNEYLQAGYPIGSGVVESACGHTVKDRMEGSGRRWSIIGSEAILLLRSIYTSNDWDKYWDFHMEEERKRNYQNLLNNNDILNLVA